MAGAQERVGGSVLVIAADRFEDPALNEMRAPSHDASALAEILADERIGDFDVTTLVNEPSHLVANAIEGFFANRRRSDLVIAYLSCHGVKDDRGRLSFAMPNTRLDRLSSTSVSAQFLNEQMEQCGSSRVVLLLDCCYSGAFARGFKGDASLSLAERFEGNGRVVLTASSALEYSFEGSAVEGAGQGSVFTEALVEGLRTGAADLDFDGLVGIDELYQYVHDRVRSLTPAQTPKLWAYGIEGSLAVARSTRTELPAVELPTEVDDALRSPLPTVRLGAIGALQPLLAGRNQAIAAAARAALEGLREDDSRAVAQAATAALAEAAPRDVPPAVVDPAVVDPAVVEPAVQRAGEATPLAPTEPASEPAAVDPEPEPELKPEPEAEPDERERLGGPEGPARGQSLRWMAAAVVLLVVLLVVALQVDHWYAERVYYVGFSGTKVEVFEAHPGGIRGKGRIVYHEVGLDASQLTADERAQVEREDRYSKPDEPMQHGYQLYNAVSLRAANAPDTTTTTSTTVP